MPPSKRNKRKPEPTDEDVRDILVHAMADVGADPALVYAFQKTGVYVCDENEKRLPKEKLKAFDGAVDEYLAATAPAQRLPAFHSFVPTPATVPAPQSQHEKLGLGC